MKVLSWNVRGMGNPQRRMVIIEVLSFNKVQIAMIQESKLSSMSDKIQRETWGGRFCKCVCVDAVDSAGGIILLWDYCTNTVLDIYYGKFSVSAWVEDSSNNSRWFVTSVYGPHSSQRPMDFWKELDAIKGRWNGTWCVGGNWNVVRFPSEKLGGCRTSPDMQAFSDWINSNSLIDLHLSGAAFTWSSHQSLPSMSKLDRFLVTTDWLELYLEVCQMALPKTASDHCPILLDSRCERCGQPLSILS